MFSFARFRAAALARSLEFLRDRSALAWNLLFPVLMVLGFALIFSGPGQPMFRVALLGATPSNPDTHPFLSTPHTQFYAEPDEAMAERKVARHRTDLLLDLRSQPPRYSINPESQKGVILERLLLASGGPVPARQIVAGRPIRYVDWALPGILGMNLMFSCLWGVGFVIVRYRKSGHLKRLNATPLTAFEFVCAQVVSRLALVLVATTVMYLGCDLFMDFPMEGRYLDLFLVTAAGTLALTAMGLLVAARVASEELSGGLLNLLSAPMMVISGVFFSLDGAPRWVQLLADGFPLTHMLAAARAVMLDGAGLSELAYPFGMLLGMTALFLAIGAGAFKWTQD